MTIISSIVASLLWLALFGVFGVVGQFLAGYAILTGVGVVVADFIIGATRRSRP